MAAKTRSSRNTQGANPYVVDLTDVPQTPALKAVHELARLEYDLRRVLETVTELGFDASELALAEGHTQNSVLRAMGRPIAWRNQFARLMLRPRNIDTTAQHWRERTEDITPAKLPGYLTPENIARLREAASKLKPLSATTKTDRDSSYPKLHQRAKAAIEGIAKAS